MEHSLHFHSVEPISISLITLDAAVGIGFILLVPVHHSKETTTSCSKSTPQPKFVSQTGFEVYKYNHSI